MARSYHARSTGPPYERRPKIEKEEVSQENNIAETSHLALKVSSSLEASIVLPASHPHLRMPALSEDGFRTI